MPSKPTFVLVPGNFLPPAYYARTAQLLESHGFSTRLTTIPSTGSKLPLTSNEPDILAVRHILEELSNAGREIIIVAHSYGSIPACEAAQGFERQERRKLGKAGGVIRLVLVAAWLLQEGESPPIVIERYKMEAPWARFEVCHSTLIPFCVILWCWIIAAYITRISTGWQRICRRPDFLSPQRHIRRRRGLLVFLHHPFRPDRFRDSAQVSRVAPNSYNLPAVRVG